MLNNQDIILAVDYHRKNTQIGWLNCHSGEERSFKCPTRRQDLLEVIQTAQQELTTGGRIVWIMESTTGWARVKDLVEPAAHLILCNVLQMPLPPKAHRRKTDKIDTARMLREYLNGQLPQAYQPARWLRELRRLVSVREDLVRRRTELSNWITSYLAHETWEPAAGLASKAGQAILERLTGGEGLDAFCLRMKKQELESVQEWIEQVEAKMLELYKDCPQAQRLDRIRGIGPISALCMWARIGPAERFATADQLIGYTGMAPGVRSSDDTRRDGHIGGGGTDAILRRLVIEASVWARQIPRYARTYERALKKRGKKVARLVVGRLLLRGLYKVLRDEVEFNPQAA